MSARQRAALAVNAAAAGVTVWAIGATIRGPGARPSIPRDVGAGALLVGAAYLLKWAGAQ